MKEYIYILPQMIRSVLNKRKRKEKKLKVAKPNPLSIHTGIWNLSFEGVAGEYHSSYLLDLYKN